MIKVAIIAWILVLVTYFVYKLYFAARPHEAWMIQELNMTPVGATIVVFIHLGSWVFAILSTIIAVIKFGG